MVRMPKTASLLFFLLLHFEFSSNKKITFLPQLSKIHFVPCGWISSKNMIFDSFLIKIHQKPFPKSLQKSTPKIHPSKHHFWHPFTESSHLLMMYLQNKYFTSKNWPKILQKPSQNTSKKHDFHASGSPGKADFSTFLKIFEGKIWSFFLFFHFCIFCPLELTA